MILLTARRQIGDKVIGLEAGADGDITKPFDPAQLVARVQAQLGHAAARITSLCGEDRATLAVDVPTCAAIRSAAPVPAPHAPSVGVPSLSPITGTLPSDPLKGQHSVEI